jgi:hypothetical protein
VIGVHPIGLAIAVEAQWRDDREDPWLRRF